MFSRIANKCKTVAKVLCWLGILMSLLFGIVYMLPGDTVSIINGLGTMIVGSFVAWVGSIGLYGIGEAVENSAIAADLAIKADSQNHNTMNE